MNGKIICVFCTDCEQRLCTSGPTCWNSVAVGKTAPNALTFVG